MKIMRRDFNKINSSRFRDIQKSAKSANFQGSCTYCGGEQGRSQDFSVGTHSFPSPLFTPAPPQKKIKVIFDSRVFYFKSRAQES